MVAHGAGDVVSNTVVPIMSLRQVRNSLRLRTIMVTAVVMNLVSSRKNTVLVGTVDTVESAGEISFVNIDGY